MSTERTEQLKVLMAVPLQLAVAVVEGLRRARRNGIPCDFDGKDAAIALLFARMLRLRRDIPLEDFKELAGAMWMLAADAQEIKASRAACPR